MSKNHPRPSTIDGIKKLARTVKRERGIPHAEALDVAAGIAGFANFIHATRAIDARPRHHVWITARWYDRPSGNRGQETLKVSFTQPFAALVTPAQAKADRYLGGIRSDAPDHLVVMSISEDANLARRRICEVARTLQFIDVTGLKPSNARRAHPRGRFDNRVPGEDHPSVWWDPVNKRHVLADEPYVRRSDPVEAERLDWAKRSGWEIHKPTWNGLYWPDGGCCLFLMADRAKGPSLKPVIEALERAPRPVTVREWIGVSGGYHEPVDTPGTRQLVAAKAATPPKARPPARKRASVAYTMTMVGKQLRPNARMPIAAHQQVGALLKSVLVAATKRDGVRHRVNAIRSELDEWVVREYNSAELDHATFTDLYYHELDHGDGPVMTREEMIGSLESAKAILMRHYPDCPPRDGLIGRADKAIASLGTWQL